MNPGEAVKGMAAGLAAVHTLYADGTERVPIVAVEHYACGDNFGSPDGVLTFDAVAFVGDDGRRRVLAASVDGGTIAFTVTREAWDGNEYGGDEFPVLLDGREGVTDYASTEDDFISALFECREAPQLSPLLALLAGFTRKGGAA